MRLAYFPTLRHTRVVRSFGNSASRSVPITKSITPDRHGQRAQGEKPGRQRTNMRWKRGERERGGKDRRMGDEWQEDKDGAFPRLWHYGNLGRRISSVAKESRSHRPLTTVTNKMHKVHGAKRGKQSKGTRLKSERNRGNKEGGNDVGNKRIKLKREMRKWIASTSKVCIIAKRYSC